MLLKCGFGMGCGSYSEKAGLYESRVCRLACLDNESLSV
jgi:hypothetical protein